MQIDNAEHTVQALDRLSFTVKDDEVVALIGPSGCGKTTALRIAMGLDYATGGRVLVDGAVVKGCATIAACTAWNTTGPFRASRGSAAP